MLNKVIVEGYVTSTWRYGSDLMIKLACYRDPHLPQQKMADSDKDKPDYVLARLVNGFAQNIDFEKQKQLRIEGFIHSIDTEENLQDYLSRSNAKSVNSKISVEIVGGQAKEVFALRSFMEVQVMNYSVIMPRGMEQEPKENTPSEKKDLANKRNDLKTTNKKTTVVVKKK